MFFWVVFRIDEKTSKRIGCASKVSSNSYILFFRSSKREKRLGRRKWNDSFPHISSFQPIFTAPEFTECGLVGQRRILNGPSFFNSFHIGGSFKMFLKSFKLWSFERVLQRELFDFDSPFSRKNMRYRHKKWSASSSVHVQFICWPFQCSTFF